MSTIMNKNLLFCDTKFEMSKLLKVVIVARHGPRNPIRVLSKLDQTVWKELKTDNEEYRAEKTALTKLGEEYCKSFGKKLSSEYKEMLSLDDNSVAFYSSHTPRTYESAILVAESFVKKKLTKNDLQFHPTISADPSVRFGDEQHVFRKLVTEINIDEVDEVVNRDELKSLIREHLGPIETTNHFFDIRSTIECYHFENVPLPDAITKKHIDDIDICAKSYYKTLASNPFMKFMGRDIHEFVIDEFLTQRNATNVDKKFVYISTHDTIVFPLSQHINSDYTKIPFFCSHIKYELYEDHIEIYYDDVKIKEINDMTL